MLLRPINLESKLRTLQNKLESEETVLSSVKAILEADNKHESSIQQRLTSNSRDCNNLNLDLLETNRIYHIDSIKTICIDYRLRFLDSHYFKPQFPYEAICKIKQLEKEHKTTLSRFKVIAPSKLMKLDNADDPLLFATLGNGYYYLIHKWGNDLHPFRKWMYWPFKNINNTLVFAIAVSFLLTVIIPSSIYDQENAVSQFWFLFLFIFKAVGFIFIFYGVSLGKNFNTQIWNSRYYNG